MQLNASQSMLPPEKLTLQPEGLHDRSLSYYPDSQTGSTARMKEPAVSRPVVPGPPLPVFQSGKQGCLVERQIDLVSVSRTRRNGPSSTLLAMKQPFATSHRTPYDMSMKSFTLFLLLLAAFLQTSCSAAADRPNIVVFLVDDMGVMDTSVPFLTDEDGNPKRYPLNDYYRTPSMERLAERGIRFNQFYAMSVCSPTRISIMTGQNAARHRTTNWINPSKDNAGTNGPPDWNWGGLKKGDVTLPGILRESGYRTIHVGKGTLAPKSTRAPNH